MKTKYLALAILSAMLASPEAYAAGKNGVAAVVNGEQIKVSEIQDVYNATPQIKSQATFEEFYPQALEVWVNSKVIQQAAKKAGVQNDPQFKKQIEEVKKDLAGKMYAQKLIEEKISDKDIKILYDEYKAQFQSSPEMKAKHILVDNEAIAVEVIEKVKKGEKFEDLATQYSKEKNPSLGYFTKEMMVPDFANAAFKLKKGEFTQKPIKTEFGYHIIMVEDLRESKPASYEEAQPQLKAMKAQQVAKGIFDDLNKKATVEKYSLDGKTLKK